MSLIGRAPSGSIAVASQAALDDVAMLAARMDRLPATTSIWKLVVLLSLGGFFEFYELFSTAYVIPGIVRSGILKETTVAFFGLVFFLISIALARGGVSAALMLIAGCMAVVACSIGLLGPNTKGRSLEVLTLDGRVTEESPQPKSQAATALRLNNQL